MAHAVCTNEGSVATCHAVQHAAQQISKRFVRQPRVMHQLAAAVSVADPV